MTIERFILLVSAVISIVSTLYIPKGEIRKALLAFLVFQTTTWFVSIVLVQMDLIYFPVREFVKATKVAFIPQFFVYPILFTWFFFLLSTKNSVVYRMVHWFFSVSIPAWFAYFIAVYTNLSEFTGRSHGKNIIFVYISFTLQYLLCFFFMKWFYKNNNTAEVK